MDYLTPLSDEGEKWKQDAREWIACDERHEGSFQWTCEVAVGVDRDGEALAEAIRQRLGITVDDEEPEATALPELVAKVEKLRRFARPAIVSGARYGRLVVVREQEGTAGRRCGREVYCRCDCGREKSFRWHEVVKGTTKSCGCSRAGGAAMKLSLKSRVERFGACAGIRSGDIG